LSTALMLRNQHFCSGYYTSCGDVITDYANTLLPKAS